MRTLYSQMYTRLQETVDGFREVSYLDELQTTMTTDNSWCSIVGYPAFVACPGKQRGGIGPRKILSWAGGRFNAISFSIPV
jgi:hypothetical protein